MGDIADEITVTTQSMQSEITEWTGRLAKIPAQTDRHDEAYQRLVAAATNLIEYEKKVPQLRAEPARNWFLLRRARQRAATRHHPASADRDLRRRVSVALDFLAWIGQRDLALADLTQEMDHEPSAHPRTDRPLHPEAGTPGPPRRRRPMAAPPALSDRRCPA
ncbi:hypothetical protein [Streptomyces sp. NBC_00658]|uniref:hypothetical protein n=1 Tax=Streptomyces sp. NBC_00658 TaxID=2975800 RepID=UPI0032569637